MCCVDGDDEPVEVDGDVVVQFGAKTCCSASMA